MQYSILKIENSQKWNELLHKLPQKQRDVYFTPDYYALYEEYGEGEAQCFAFQKDGDLILYPFLKNSINALGYQLDKEYYDIQGAYGYNGIISSTKDTRIIINFFKMFNEFCLSENIITEFGRNNPLIDNLYNNTYYTNIYNSENIYVDLTIEDIFNNSYEYATRKNIKKAIRNSLDWYAVTGDKISLEEIKVFYNIYKHTMERNNADEFYFFNEQYFNDIASFLSERALFGFVLKETKIIACELVLLGCDIAYSYLGGTLSDYYAFRPNDFLKHNVITYLKKIGYKYFLLGGGSDGVIRYKKSFSIKGTIPFYIIKKIYNQKIYDDVVEQWKTNHPLSYQKHTMKLLGYREI